MAAIKIKWSSLLNLTELEFIPEPPKVLSVSDELLQTISWLTGATGHDRRLLRCTEQGALLVGDPWSLLASVETDELHPAAGAPDTFTAAYANKGVLIATSTHIVKVSVRRANKPDTEHFYMPPAWLYWYPHKVYDVIATVVPAGTGTASYVGIAAFN